MQLCAAQWNDRRLGPVGPAPARIVAREGSWSHARTGRATWTPSVDPATTTPARVKVAGFMRPGSRRDGRGALEDPTKTGPWIKNGVFKFLTGSHSPGAGGSVAVLHIQHTYVWFAAINPQMIMFGLQITPAITAPPRIFDHQCACVGYQDNDRQHVPGPSHLMSSRTPGYSSSTRWCGGTDNTRW